MQKILVTVAEAACLLNYSTATIYKLINSGQLPYIKSGLSPPSYRPCWAHHDKRPLPAIADGSLDLFNLFSLAS